MLLGADRCYFVGALRTSLHIPLLENLDRKPSGLGVYFPDPCPCSMFTDFHPCPAESGEEKIPTSYYMTSKAPGSAHVDPDTANRSIHGLEFDATANVMVCLAHDPALFEVLPLLKGGDGESVNTWKEWG